MCHVTGEVFLITMDCDVVLRKVSALFTYVKARWD
jgi:hypothetical protein